MKEIKIIDKYTGVDIGYVYVIECDGHYKIGKTLTCTTRFYEYTKLFTEPKLVYCDLVNDYTKIEADLHKMFNDKHTRGEWFDLSEEDLKLIKKYLDVNRADGYIGFMPRKESSSREFSNTKSRNDYMTDKMAHKFKVNTKEEVSQDCSIIMSKEASKIAKILFRYPTTFVALHLMLKYLKPNSNCLIKGNKKYKLGDLAEEMGISKQAAGKHFEKLCSANIIAKYYSKQGVYWAVNPSLFIAVGKKPDSNIVKLFENKGN